MCAKPNSGLTPEPKVGAQCGSSARWDLRGGRPDPDELRAAPTATAAVGERLYGIVGEGRPEQVAADTLESLAVAAVDGGRGVQVESEG